MAFDVADRKTYSVAVPRGTKKKKGTHCVSAIAATEILARHFGVSKVLVVSPTSLKYQWQSEIMRFSGRPGENAARVINGGRAQRQKDYALDDFCKITNYEKLKPDLDLIAAWAPELVIVDEAQRVKNWNTIAARALTHR